MKYSLGLDIGTTSIGWAINNHDKQRIEECGVRIFERPENPKNGQSLALPRREARSSRHRIKRRRQRLDYLKNFFIEHQLLEPKTIEHLLTPHKNPLDPYICREKGIKEKLTTEELFIALYHIAKHRGYKSNRQSQVEKEDGDVLVAISKNKELLEKYHTTSIAQILNHDPQFASHKRNKNEDYSSSFIREDFLAETKALLEKQQELGLNLNQQNLDELLFTPNQGIFYQRPFMTPELIEKMRGKCQFEKDKPRGQKASFTFDIFRFAQDLSHTVIHLNGIEQNLTEEEITKILNAAKNIRGITYKKVREILGYKNNSDMSFAYIKGKKDKDDPEKNQFSELKFYHDVKKTLRDSPEEWKKIEDNQDLFDQIGYILAANKDDKKIEQELKSLGISNDSIQELLKLNFSGFAHLSIKAMRQITPHLLKGMTYDKAVEKAHYTFSQKLSGDKNKLPPLSDEQNHQLTNPVVKRAVSQTIKIINAVVDKYDAPYQIKIECAGELGKSFQERNEIKKAQDENAKNNEGIKNELKNDFHVNVTGLQITKYKLHKEQDCKCPYCGGELKLEQLFSDEHYGEIDHIIPFSRCGNDSNSNKVLVHNSCNQNKTNKTPFETWGNDENRWQQFTELINGLNKLPYNKKQRLLAKTPPKEDWNSRALNDTRYITRFIANHIKNNLHFTTKEGQKVLTPQGQTTNYLRRWWRIGSKDRDVNNLHHAVDACIIAAVDQAIISNFARYNKYSELGGRFFKKYVEGMKPIIDPDTKKIIDQEKFAQLREELLPWKDFDQEVKWRAQEYTSLEEFNDAKPDGLYANDEDFLDKIHPIFVSRMPKRNGTGPAHTETIRSPLTEGKTVKRAQKVSIKSILPKDLDNLLCKNTDKQLYETIKERLNWGIGMEKEDKTFGKSSGSDSEKKRWCSNTWKDSIYKKNKKGKNTIEVHSVKVLSSQPSGFLINNNTQFVNNGSMVRLDVYKKENAKGKTEHFFVPIYVHQIKTGSTKIMPSPKGFTDVDETFTKVCNLYPNDYVQFIFDDENKNIEGYYVKYGIGNGAMIILPHSAANKDKNSTIQISARTAKEIKRLDISVLGDNYQWK